MVAKQSVNCEPLSVRISLILMARPVLGSAGNRRCSCRSCRRKFACRAGSANMMSSCVGLKIVFSVWARWERSCTSSGNPLAKTGAFRSSIFYLRQRKLHMKTSRFTDSRIIAILKQAEAGSPVRELCREHGISNATFSKGRAKFGGLGCVVDGWYEG